MEILRFSADAFYSIGRAAGTVVTILKGSEPHAVLGGDTKIMLSEALKNIRGHCETIGLTMSIKSIQRVTGDMDANKTADRLYAGWKDLDDRISDEIADNLFLRVGSNVISLSPIARTVLGVRSVVISINERNNEATFAFNSCASSVHT
jgi:hypothetical protein